MTYHDRSLATACRAIAPLPGTLSERPSRNALDRKSRIVVGLSLRDPSHSVDRDGRVPRLLSRLFGISTPAPLADPRLESLRRFCILYRNGDSRSMAESELLTRDFGYSEDAMEDVRTEIRLWSRQR